MKIIVLIFWNFLIKAILSVEILKKYKEMKTSSDNIVFESKDFSENEEMRFSIQIIDDYNYNREICGNSLYYNYYDSVESIDYANTPYLNLANKTDRTSATVYFNLFKKKRTELGGLSGNYLLMRFDCHNYRINIKSISITTSNFTSKDFPKSDMIVSIVFPIFAVCVIIFMLWGCIHNFQKCTDYYSDSDDVVPNPNPSPADSYSNGSKNSSQPPLNNNQVTPINRVIFININNIPDNKKNKNNNVSSNRPSIQQQTNPIPIERNKKKKKK